MIAFYAAACALGALAGLAFAWLWLRVVPPGTNRAFWSSMSQLTRRLLEVEQTGEFLRLYRQLGGLLARYVGRNLAGTLVVLHGLLPHWSDVNRSARSRHAYSVHCISGDAEYPAWNWLQRPADLPLRHLGTVAA